MAVVWKEIAYKDDLDSHASQHGVSGSDSVFPADPDGDRVLMWDDVPGELVWSSAGTGDVIAAANITDHSIVRGDGGAKGIQDSTAIITDSGQMYNPSQPAFSAYISSAALNVTGDNSQFSLHGEVSWTEVFDQGGDGDFSSGTFTAPIAGKYQLSGILYISGITAGHTIGVVWIVTSNRNYITVYNRPEYVCGPNGYLSMAFSVLADMDASDTAYLRLEVDGIGKTVDINVDSFFTGVLIC